MNGDYNFIEDEWIYNKDVSLLTDLLSNSYNIKYNASLENEVLNKVMLEELFGFIEDRQLRAISKLYIIGLSKANIKKYLNINNYLLGKKNKQIKQIINEFYDTSIKY